MNRSNNHSVQLFLEPHFNNSHNTLPSLSMNKKLHIPTLHFYFNSSLTLRLHIPTPTHFSATPLPPSMQSPLFHRQLPHFLYNPHHSHSIPISQFPFQSTHTVKFSITHLTPIPRLQPMSPLPSPNCPTPSRDPSPPVTPPASPSSCSAVAPVLPSVSPSCRRSSARQAARWLSHSVCSRSASSASAERSRRDVSRAGSAGGGRYSGRRTDRTGQLTGRGGGQTRRYRSRHQTVASDVHS